MEPVRPETASSADLSFFCNLLKYKAGYSMPGSSPGWHGPCTLLRYRDSDCSSQPEVATMKWETPTYNDIRFGFEVTMYINNK